MGGEPGLALTLADFEAQARARMTPAAWAYLAGGAGDEHTLAANARDWQGWRLLPRTLRPLAGSHTGVTVGPHQLAHPILLAPVAWHRLAHPEGEAATALAAAAQGAGLVLSLQSSVAMETVGALLRSVPGSGPFWQQLYWQLDRGHTLALVQRAEAAGAQALVLTVDAPVHGVRDRERRAGFLPPPGVQSVHLEGMTQGDGRLEPLFDAAPGWDELAWLKARTRLPLWLKGVLHPDDARLAADSGLVDGLIVSNHGGRALDTAVSTAWALPRVAEAVAGRLPLLVDGGIRRGTDVAKALALGAQAVLVGRPQVHALAADGAHGVARMIRLLRDEFAIALALCGCRHPGELGPQHLVAPG